MYRALCAALAAVVTLSGCFGDGRPPRAEVTGTVTYQGKAVADADVAFRAPKASRISYGRTDSAGRFKLSTYGDNDGALVGANTVTVSKPQSTGPVVTDLTSPEYIAAMKQMQAPPKSEIPLKYNDATNPLIAFEVKAGTKNDFPIELKD